MNTSHNQSPQQISYQLLALASGDLSPDEAAEMLALLSVDEAYLLIYEDILEMKRTLTDAQIIAQWEEEERQLNTFLEEKQEDWLALIKQQDASIAAKSARIAARNAWVKQARPFFYSAMAAAAVVALILWRWAPSLGEVDSVPMAVVQETISIPSQRTQTLQEPVSLQAAVPDAPPKSAQKPTQNPRSPGESVPRSQEVSSPRQTSPDGGTVNQEVELPQQLIALSTKEKTHSLPPWFDAADAVQQIGDIVLQRRKQFLIKEAIAGPLPLKEQEQAEDKNETPIYVRLFNEGFQNLQQESTQSRGLLQLDSLYNMCTDLKRSSSRLSPELGVISKLSEGIMLIEIGRKAPENWTSIEDSFQKVIAHPYFNDYPSLRPLLIGVIEKMKPIESQQKNLSDY